MNVRKASTTIVFIIIAIVQIYILLLTLPKYFTTLDPLNSTLSLVNPLNSNPINSNPLNSTLIPLNYTINNGDEQQ